ncbi:MAG TPA: phosphoglycerate dehydrogenase [Anaerolineae bacterium]|nr:phosphoglycerate dehydrogenase [Anaerolineae bacterium]
MTHKVLVSDPLAEAGLALLREAGLHVDVRTDLSPAQLIQTIPDYDALIIRSGTQVTADVIRAGQKLKVIARAGVGVDNIDIPAATEAGIIVANAPTGNVAAAAEHTIALLFALARHVAEAHRSMREGAWDRKAFMGVEIANKTLGLVGLGRVAGHVCRRAVGLGMNVLAYDPYVSQEYAQNMGAELVSLDDLLARSDFISLHLPLNEATRGLINAETLAKVKPGARLINTSRGGVIDERALLAALDSGQLAGAALDVFTQEPLPPDSPLRTHPRVVLTPHIGGSTTEAQFQVALDAAQQVIDVLHDRPARYAINAPLIPERDVEFIHPFIGLVERMGRFLQQFHPMQVERVELIVHGPLAEYDTKILQAAALRGLLAGVVEERVNVVNADLIAFRRGIIVSEYRQRHHYERYENMVTLAIRSGEQSVNVKGSVLHGEPFIVAVADRWVEFQPEGHYLVSWHEDRPGVIGALGTLLGENDINIAFMHVGRLTPRGVAIIVLKTDEPIPSTLLPQINAILGRDFEARIIDL